MNQVPTRRRRRTKWTIATASALAVLTPAGIAAACERGDGDHMQLAGKNSSKHHHRTNNGDHRKHHGSSTTSTSTTTTTVASNTSPSSDESDDIPSDGNSQDANSETVETLTTIVLTSDGSSDGSSDTSSDTSDGTSDDTSSDTPTSTPTTSPSTTTTVKATTTTVAVEKTYKGSVVNPGYGNIQVQITTKAGRVTSVKAIQYPTDGNSGSINSSAIPKLQSEALTAQSANIASVSGATYTSKGFKQSLQAALSAAHMA